MRKLLMLMIALLGVVFTLPPDYANTGPDLYSGIEIDQIENQITANAVEITIEKINQVVKTDIAEVPEVTLICLLMTSDIYISSIAYLNYFMKNDKLLSKFLSSENNKLNEFQVDWYYLYNWNIHNLT